ncbi:hypothetical protein LTS18_011699, partial [Coniosporium uncinatum]
MTQNTNGAVDPSRLGTSFRSQLNSFTSSSPIAQAAIAQDLEDTIDDTEDAEPDENDDQFVPQGHSMCEGYRRPSAIATGPRPTFMPSLGLPDQRLSKKEREAMREDERSLLRDNQVIPPNHPRKRASEDNVSSVLRGKRLSFSGLTRSQTRPGEDTGMVRGEEPWTGGATETSALLGGNPTLPYGGQDSPEVINKKWEEAVSAGKINTTWQREAKVLAKYSRSLILTFILQYSLTMASIFTVGHIGKVELGAVSLASMTANITGYSIYQGLATSLDTLCAQAYGSGKRTLVGLQLQRMVYFLWLITIPIGIVWLAGARILEAIVPEKRTAELAGLYLKILLAG